MFFVRCIEGPATSGTGVGNPPTSTATFTLKAVSPPPPLLKRSAPAAVGALPALTMRDAKGLAFTITTAMANVRHVEVRLPEGTGCNQVLEEECEENEIRIKGPFGVDLLTGRSSPPMDTIRIPSGVYNRTEIRLDDRKLEDGFLDGLGEMIGHSLVIKGMFEYKERTDRRFAFLLEFNEDIPFENPNGLAVNDSGTQAMVVKLNVQEWVSRIDIGKCLDDGDITLDAAGDLLIDEESGCENLEDALGAAIKGSGDFDEEVEPEEPPED